MKPLLAPLLIALGATLSAQPTYIRTFSPIPYVWGVAATPTGGLVVAGNFSDEQGYLLRLDRDGDVAWMKRYTALSDYGFSGGLQPCGLNRFNALTVAADGRLLVAGTACGSLTGQRSVTCFDSSGTWLWGHASGVATHTETLDLAAAGEDSTVIFAGNSPDLFYQHATLFRFAAGSGTFLGGAKMFGGIDTRPTSIDFSADGNVLMTTGQHGHQLMKLTPDLAPIWRLSWANFSSKWVCGQADGRTVAANDTVIAVIDPSGTVAWIKELVVDGGVRDIAVRPDGRILALGQNGTAYAWLMEIDSTGAIQWIRRYGNDGEDMALSRLELLPDGSSFLIGYNTTTDALCVVSVDQNGELADCPFPTLSADVTPFAPVVADTLPTFEWSLESPLAELQEVDSTATTTVQIACGSVGYATTKPPPIPVLEVFPNPMTDHVGLIAPKPLGSDARIEILDVTGKVMHTMIGNGTQELSFERGGMGSGLYLLRVTRPGTATRNARLLVQ